MLMTIEKVEFIHAMYFPEKLRQHLNPKMFMECVKEDGIWTLKECASPSRRIKEVLRKHNIKLKV